MLPSRIIGFALLIVFLACHLLNDKKAVTNVSGSAAFSKSIRKQTPEKSQRAGNETALDKTAIDSHQSELPSGMSHEDSPLADSSSNASSEPEEREQPVALQEFKSNHTTGLEPITTDVILNAAEALAQSAPSLKIDVYGGSITGGSGVSPNETYSALLERNLLQSNVNVTVSNKGIGGSGPEHWSLCGIEKADIVVSEYRINEQNPAKLKEWYELLHQEGVTRHVVILDLWSWLTPPNGPAMTVKVLNNLKFADADVSFSVLDINQLEHDTWRKRVAEGDFDHPSIPHECHESVFERNQEEIKNIERCRKMWTPGFQHGYQKYHRHVAGLLTDHMQHHVLPIFKQQGWLENETAPATSLSKPESTPDQICAGRWGMDADRMIEWQTQGIILNNTGFHINSDTTGRADKVTLNTNASFASNASLILSCPAGYSGMSLGYVAHTAKDEAATVTVNGRRELSTYVRGPPPVLVFGYDVTQTDPMTCQFTFQIFD